MRAQLLGLAVPLLAFGVTPLMAAPMEPLVLNQSTPVVEHPIGHEQAHLDQMSARYIVEVSDDEHLPLDFRKPTAPQGASLVTFSW